MWAPCLWHPFTPFRHLSSTVVWIFLRVLSGNVLVFCTIWYDSGYLLCQFTVSVWQQRQVRTEQTVPGPARGDPTGAVLGYVIDMPEVVHVKVVDITVVAQRPFPLVQTVCWAIDIHQLLNTVTDVPVVRSYRFSRAGCG